MHIVSNKTLYFYGDGYSYNITVRFIYFMFKPNWNATFIIQFQFKCLRCEVISILVNITYIFYFYTLWKSILC
ncbi:hypothetical protein ABW07_03900 [Pluralibacter gergoviae]|nr:hypothetical protein ABW07_03900 [Pluralibacter gergoviae]